MTSVSVVLWIASLAGAALFLFAGLRIGRTGMAGNVGAALAHPPAAGVGAAGAAATSATDPAHVQLASAERELAAVRTELAHSRAEVNRVGLELQHQRVEVVSQSAAATATRAELSRMREDASVADRARLETQRELERRDEKLRALELRLEEVRGERTRLLEQQVTLEQKLAGVDPEVEKGLRLDLALVRERLQAQEDRGRRLDEVNLAQAEEAKELRANAERLAVLERENAELRVLALTSGPPRTTQGAVSTHGLDALVAEVAGLAAVRSAVIGDELGLVVSCQGDHGDELAAVGALFNRACSEALRVLPLARIQRIAVEDERQVTITMRPLRTSADPSHEDQLTLVTLAQGGEPDPQDLARILHREHEIAV